MKNINIQIEKGVKFLNNSVMSNIPDNCKAILDKGITGCGLTTYYLKYYNKPIILCSPRKKLLKNKLRQSLVNPFIDDTKTIQYKLFYLEIVEDKSEKDYITELNNYLFECSVNNYIPKLMVCYDSFTTLCNLLTQLHQNLSTFKVIVDECQCIIKDSTMKETNGTTTSFISLLFNNFNNILFASATPMINYLCEISSFNDNVDYYIELDWLSKEKIIHTYQKCRSELDAFDRIYNDYQKRGNFDVRLDKKGNKIESKEAVIFLNNVKDIVSIIKKYNLSDVNVICSDGITQKNKKFLKPFINNVPLKGEKHYTWTFCTRASFEGVDFYSTNASTYVITNYNVDCLSVDIMSDIPQIIGRQRLEDNHFRKYITIYYKTNNNIPTQEEFDEMVSKKMNATSCYIDNFNASPHKEFAVNSIKEHLYVEVDKKEFTSYITLDENTNTPVHSEYLIINDKFNYDVLKNHQNWFIVNVNEECDSDIDAGNIANKMIEEISEIKSNKTHRDRTKKVYQYMKNYPEISKELKDSLTMNGFKDIRYYFDLLSIDRIYANNGDRTKMDNEISKTLNNL